MNILEQISNNISKLTKKQQLVAKYILDNWQIIPYQSSIEIARNLAISQSSVMHATKALGFNSFPKLQDDLQVFSAAMPWYGDIVLTTQLPIDHHQPYRQDREELEEEYEG